MNKPDFTRNISIVGGFSSGKTSLVRQIIQLDSKNTTVLAQDETTEIRVTNNIMPHNFVINQANEKDTYHNYLINVLDCPGHVDLSNYAAAAIKISDGAILVIDCKVGTCILTEKLIQCCLMETIKPTIIINKIDDLIKHPDFNSENIYQQLWIIVQEINKSTKLDQMAQLSPSNGTICFGSALGGWVFSIPFFANFYSRKYGGSVELWCQNLWDDHFYNTKKNIWSNQQINYDGTENIRGFTLFVIQPILDLLKYVQNGVMKKTKRFIDYFEIMVNVNELSTQNIDLFNIIVKAFIPISKILQENIISFHSPKTAQQNRVDLLYTGSVFDDCYKAIQNSDPCGPLVFKAIKMERNANEMNIFGRIYAGTIKIGEKIIVIQPNNQILKDKTPIVIDVKGIFGIDGYCVHQQIDNVPCGNLVWIQCDENEYMHQRMTMSTCNQCSPINPSNTFAENIIRVTITTNSDKESKILEKSARQLFIKYEIDEDADGFNELIIECSSEYHLKETLSALQSHSAIQFSVSQPFIDYRATITQKSEYMILSKSANKMNWFKFDSEPMQETLLTAIEQKRFVNDKNTAKILIDEFGWDNDEARQVYYIGRNILVDCTRGVSFIEASKEKLKQYFEKVINIKGVLCCETIGIVYKLRDARLRDPSEPRYCGPGQLFPAMRSAMFGCQLVSKPILIEPIYNAEILCPSDIADEIILNLRLRRGKLTNITLYQLCQIQRIRATVPVAESFGLHDQFVHKTISLQLMFSECEIVDSDPLQIGSVANFIVRKLRKKNGYKLTEPSIADYDDGDVGQRARLIRMAKSDTHKQLQLEANRFKQTNLILKTKKLQLDQNVRYFNHIQQSQDQIVKLIVWALESK